MEKNNDFENNNNQNDLDEYIAREISNYYGEDVMNTVNNTAPTPPPKRIKRRTRKLYSALSVICAVVFLTGVIIFSGVFFSSGVPTANLDNTPDSTSSEASSTLESDSEFTDSENVRIESNGSDSDINSSYSSNEESSKAVEGDSDYLLSNSSGDTVSSDNNDLTSSENNSSNIASSEKNDDNTESGTSSAGNDLSENSGSSNTDSETSSKGPSYFDGNSAVTSNATASNESSTAAQTVDIPSRPTYYSLPEIPDEGTVTSVHTDLDNNSTTNPYDNVTTGRRVRAGIGIALMTMSLAVSLVLNKLKTEKETY